MNRTKAGLAAVLPFALAGLGTAHADSGPGCGLGQQIWAGQSGLAAHVLAATTNGSVSYNQLFGLSFDSLGCNGESVITAAYQQDVFVAQNIDNLARDAALGGGEYLTSLAGLMTLDPAETSALEALAQREYDALFGHPTQDPQEWLDRLAVVMADDDALAPHAPTIRRS